MSVEKFIITKEDTHFSIIPNRVAQELKDAEALGLWIYLQTLAPNWEFHKNHIRKHFNWGRDKLEKKLSVLKECNLVEPHALRDPDGKFNHWTLNVRNGRDFKPIQNTENPYSGDLSTGLSKNSTQYTENTAAAKPGTGFSTPIKDIYRKEIDYKKKSFCEDQKLTSNSKAKASCTESEPAAKPKSKSAWQEENAKRHDFADSKNQMARESAYIAEHETIKRTPMPDELRQKIRNLGGGRLTNGANKDGRGMQKNAV